MYEYAATAIAPNNSGASFEAKNIAVGPSAPPIMAIAEAFFNVNSNPGTRFNAIAPNKVPKIPNCAAAPSSSIRGLAIKALKSVIAPTPINMSSGNTPVSIPT
eukprot:TRINITY_DN2691_c0_g2_i1.p1 TRINITY_DN2691_c0_g2~~TRINITY_DN2691_c0_g2_i1.p1  ORF type:complete len:103 (-),score=7.04 TRINITY_DN2691_c0_g2_i1:102-410(-)